MSARSQLNAIFGRITPVQAVYSENAMRQMTEHEINQCIAAQVFADCMLKIVWAVERADELLVRVMGRS